MSKPPADPAERRMMPLPSPATIPARRLARIGSSILGGVMVITPAVREKKMAP